MRARPDSTIDRLLETEMWLLGLLAAAAFAAPGLLFAVPCAWLGFALLRRFSRGVFLTRTPADLPLALLALLGLASLFISADVQTSLPQVLRLWSGVCLFYAVSAWATQPPRLKLLLALLSLAGLALAFFALFSVQWETGKIPLLPAALYQALHPVVADTVNPNVMAGALVILLPAAGVLFLGGPRRSGWALWLLAGICGVGMSAILLISASRGAWLAAAAALAALVVLRWRFGWVGVAALGLAAVAAAYRSGIGSLLEALAASATLGGAQGRVDVWSRAVMMLRDFPFTGVGMGMYGRAVDLIYPYAQLEAGRIVHAHNLLLQIGADLGIPGLVAWLAALLALLAACLRRLPSWRSPDDSRMWRGAAGAAFLASLAALLAHGMLDAVTWGVVRSAPLVWVVWALAGGAAAYGTTAGASLPDGNAA